MHSKNQCCANLAQGVNLDKRTSSNLEATALCQIRATPVFRVHRRLDRPISLLRIFISYGVFARRTAVLRSAVCVRLSPPARLSHLTTER